MRLKLDIYLWSQPSISLDKKLILQIVRRYMRNCLAQICFELLVVSAAADWSLSEATLPMSLAMGVGGLAGAILGNWRMRVGTRASMMVGACAIGSGYALCAMGKKILTSTYLTSVGLYVRT